MNERDDHRRHTRCSFCGKDQSQVQKLVAGPGFYIATDRINLDIAFGSLLQLAPGRAGGAT